MSVTLETLDKLRNQLQQIKDLGTPIKADLYTHLTEVFNRIMLHHPNDAFDKFEEISGLVKKTNFKIKDPNNDYEVNTKAGEIQNKQMLELLDKARKLLQEQGEPQTYCVIPNYPENAEMLEWAGISFGEVTNQIIQKSLKRLAKVSGAKFLQFFGKILCTKQDYWVAQGALSEAEESPFNKQQELRGQGVNQMVYWVTSDLLGDWIQLPDAQPAHIIFARLFKKKLSGDLNASIDTCPPFPGKERHLLRAQLGRIQHAAQLAPKGMFEVDEESQEVKFTEEQPPMDTETLRSLENWSHFWPSILKAGRCTHSEPEGIVDEEEKAAFMEKQAEEDKAEERFRAVQEDSQLFKEASWIAKVCGDTQGYNIAGGEGTKTYAVNVIKSLRWPGAVSVAKNGKYCNIYVGDCIKKGDSMFNPTDPPEVMADPDDGDDTRKEQPEPQGKEPEVKKEAAEGDGEDAGEEE